MTNSCPLVESHESWRDPCVERYTYFANQCTPGSGRVHACESSYALDLHIESTPSPARYFKRMPNGTGSVLGLE